MKNYNDVISAAFRMFISNGALTQEEFDKANGSYDSLFELLDVKFKQNNYEQWLIHGGEFQDEL